MSFEQELKEIIACKQSDGYLVKWAKDELAKLKATENKVNGGNNGNW